MSTPKTYRYWTQHSQDDLKTRVFAALKDNINYSETGNLGVPASSLDGKVFSQDESFIQDAPYISTLVQNPNHIGCHTLGESESFFKGTQAIERELIELCAVDILGGQPGEHDGYVASGGTEANMQAIWIYRNYFMREYGVSSDAIAIICSADSHYSMDKASDVFGISLYQAAVDEDSREVSKESLKACLDRAKAEGKGHFIVIANMMTTMFGSVDSVSVYAAVLKAESCSFKLHIDGAYGGFFFPFTEGSEALSFRDEDVSSVTLDAHKMAQAPYGTGIFLVRKGLMQYATTASASYVEGEDCTLIGSRSGANAIAVWMILMKHGPYGWHEKIFVLQKRSDWIAERLDELHVAYFRQAGSNIITMKAECIPADLAKEFGLVPDNHHDARWYKIVVMEHVTIEKVMPLIKKLSKRQNKALEA